MSEAGAGGFPAVTREEWERRTAPVLAKQGRPTPLIDDDGEPVARLYVARDGRTEMPPPGVAPYLRGRLPLPERYPGIEATTLVRIDARGAALDLDEALAQDPDCLHVLTTGSAIAAAPLERFLEASRQIPTLAFDAADRGIELVAALAAGGILDRTTARLEIGLDPFAGSASGVADRRGQALDALELLGPSPAVRLLALDARFWHLAGATMAQELGIVLASAHSLLAGAEERGAEPERTVRQCVLRVALDTDLFAGIAKQRALRWVWTRLLEAWGCADAAADLVVHAETSRRRLSAIDPHVNLLRATTSAMAAALGSADRITILPYTTPCGTLSESARRLASNTRRIVNEEAHLDRVLDPAGGSFFVEQRTRELAEAGWSFFQEIERRGGLVAGLEDGWLGGAVAVAAQARARRVALGEVELTGVTAYPPPADKLPDAVPSDVSADPMLRAERLSEPYEALWMLAGTPPHTFVATLGGHAESSERFGWLQNLLAIGGITTRAAFPDSDAVAAWLEQSEPVAILAGSAAAYEREGRAVAAALKGAGCRHVMLVGDEGERAVVGSELVERSLAPGQDIHATLLEVHRLIGAAQDETR